MTVLDTANFDAVVMDETKDVLVEFYAVRVFFESCRRNDWIRFAECFVFHFLS